MNVQHTTVDQGKTGAKRQSWKKASPRTILIKLIAENPHETRQDEEKILELLWEQVKDDEDTIRVMCEYWGVNNYKSIVYRSDDALKIEREKKVKEAKASIMTKILLLDWNMPNGKKLRDCNKSDCVKTGGWLLGVAKKLKANQTVGQVFSEKQLKKLFK